MSSPLPRPLTVTRAPQPAHVSRHRPMRRLRVAAGFYQDQAMAEMVRRCLVDEHGLKPSQLTLLQPTDAEPTRYAGLARRWTLNNAPQQLLAAPGWAGWLSQLLAWLPSWMKNRRSFDITVQRRLGGGDFALLVHGINLAQQAAVVRDLRGTGHHWCADAPRMRRC